MPCYFPKRKTANGTEDIKLPLRSINGLEEKINEIKSNAISMPIIRLAAVSDKENTMIISKTNPLQFTIEIISGSLKIGDEVQICTRQLFTYKEKNKRKYKLRR